MAGHCFLATFQPLIGTLGGRTAAQRYNLPPGHRDYRSGSRDGHHLILIIPGPKIIVIPKSRSRPSRNRDHGLVYHVDQLRAGFVSRTGRKCDTCKTLDFSTLWFGTRRSKVQILSPASISTAFVGSGSGRQRDLKFDPTRGACRAPGTTVRPTPSPRKLGIGSDPENSHLWLRNPQPESGKVSLQEFLFREQLPVRLKCAGLILVRYRWTTSQCSRAPPVRSPAAKSRLSECNITSRHDRKWPSRTQ